MIYIYNLKKIFYRHKYIIYKFFNYYIFTILSAIVSFGSISYLTHVIPVSGYGYLGILTSISFFIPSLLSFNAVGLIQINIVNFDHHSYIKFRNNFITFCIVGFFITELFALSLSSIWSDYISVIQFSIIYGLLTLLTTVHNGELIQNGKASQFGILNFLTGLLSFSIAIVLISILGMGWEGRAWSFIIAELILLFVRFLLLSNIGKNFSLTFQIDEWKYFLKYGSTLWLGLIAGWIINQADRFIILHYLTIEDVGIYSAGAGMSGFLVMINATMVKVFAPVVYNALKNNKEKKFILKFFSVYAIVIFIIALAICLFTLLFLPLFFGEKYLEARWIICILTLAQAFFGMYQVVGLVLEYLKLNSLRSIIVSIAAILCLTFGIILIPVVGIHAPAIGNLIAFIILALLTLYHTHKIFRNCSNFK